LSRRRYDVCAAVVSDLTYDARVWKEARSLSGAGYEMRLLGCSYGHRGRYRHHTDGIDVFEASLGDRSSGVSIPRRARALFLLWVEILRTRARVYHAHNIHIGPPAWLASRLRGAALVYDAHELYGEPADTSTLARLVAVAERTLERFLIKRSDEVVTTNRFRAEQLQRQYARNGIVVLGNVPAVVEEVSPLDPGYPDAPVLLYQGGIYAEDRPFRETIQAIAELEDIHLVILGFGRDPDLRLIRRWSDEAGVPERVHLLPPRPFDELVRTAAAATVGLVPVRTRSTNEYLGDTNKLFEYLMGGLPVVASDLPEIRRVVTAGQPDVGELFDPSSPASIAAAVRQVLADPELYARRRVEARRLALELFNWKVEEQRLLDLYARLSSFTGSHPIPGERA
jgi:glycosyltransferase involved in cell wall biosynthesis